MGTGLEMGECLTSCVVGHVLNWEGVVVMADMYVPTTNAWHVSRPTVTTGSSSLIYFFMRRRCAISPCLHTDDNYSIEFPNIDESHKVVVRNSSLLFELFRSAHCRPLFREATLLLLSWRLPTISSSPSRWSISSRDGEQMLKGIRGKNWTEFLTFIILFVSTNSIVTKVITYSISTGILTRLVFNTHL